MGEGAKRVTTFGSFGMPLSAARNWLKSRLDEESTQWVLWIPAALGLGAALFLMWPAAPPLWFGTAVMAPLILLTVKVRQHEFARAVGVILILITAGFMAAQARDFFTAHPVLPRAQGPVWLQATITDVDHKEKTVRLTLSDLQLEEMPRYPFVVPDTIRISVRGEVPEYYAGDRVRALAKLMPLTAPTVPGGYDFSVLQYYNGLGATGFSFGKPQVIAQNQKSDWQNRMENARQFVRERIFAALPGQFAEAAIGTAIFTGEQNEIPKTEANQLRDSGLYHIISISGLHISYVAVLIFFLVRRSMALAPPLALYLPTKKIAAAVALLGIVAYTYFCGAPSPAQRSCLMAGIALLAMLIDRSAISLRTIALAAVVIILLEPEQVYSVSFQLSFAAVTGLISAFEFFHPRIQAFFMDRPWFIRIWRAPVELFFTSIVATLATMPFVFYNFQNTQLLGVVANMIAVPLTGIWVMPFGCLAFFLMPFGLDDYAFWAMGQGLHVILWIAREVAALPGAVWHLPALPPLAMVFFTLGFLWLCLWQRPWRLIGLVIILCGFLTFPLVRQPDLLVAPGGKVIALRRDDGSYIFQGSKRENYYRDSWAQWFGIDENALDIDKDQPELGCDDDKCLITRGGKKIALIRTENGFEQSCAAGANILMTVKQLKGFRGECPTARTIRYWDGMDNGTYAFYFRNGDWVYENANDRRGNRVWVK